MSGTDVMAGRKKGDDAPPKRLNRSVGVGEALGRALEPALRKRGFASRDILAHWTTIAPAPWDAAAAPDRLAWPRAARGAEGATLYLRCLPGHALALQHEGEQIAGAINRYFGYFLVGTVRMSVEPLVPKEPDTSPAAAAQPDGAIIEAVAAVEDDALRGALARLGAGMKHRGGRQSGR